MQTKSTITTALTLVCLVLGACGRPDNPAATIEQPSPVILAQTQPARGDIVDLLRNPPNDTQSVVISVYNWRGDGRQPDYTFDEQRCPTIRDTSLLVDTLIPEAINFTSGGYGNWVTQYPPNEVAWLIPMFESTVRTMKLLPPRSDQPPTTPADALPPGTPLPTPTPGVPAGAYPPPTPVPMMTEPPADNTTAGPTYLGQRLRLRGRLNEPIFAHCPHAERIFVIEQIIESIPGELRRPSQLFVPPIPADYAQWQCYSDPELNFSFSYPPGWRIEGAKEPGKLGSLILHAPQWPQHHIRLQVTPAAPARREPHYYAARVDLTDVRKVLGLETQEATFPGQVIVREVGPYRWFVTETFTANGRDYELSMNLPMGIYANSELTNAFAFIGVTFQPAVTNTPAVVAR